MSVVVIGGGPGGSSCAAVLAKHGTPVILLEKTTHPRHHVGESMQPATLDLLDHHLALGAKLRSMGFGRKYGAAYVWGESREPWTVLFDARLEGRVETMSETELLEGDYEHALNVERARFDHALLGAARAEGVDVREGWEALELRRIGGRICGLRARDPSGGVHDLSAEHIIDASGQRCWLGRQLGTTRVVQDMSAVASYAYFDGAGGFPSALGRHVQWVETLPEGWAWFIPIGGGRTSVGIVHRGRKRLDLKAFQAGLAQTRFALQGARLCTDLGQEGLFFARDWSFTHPRFCGPGYWMVGDAACFVDPILSGGIDFAIRGGCRAALAILRGSDGEDESLLQDEYDDLLRSEYRAYLRLARYWYGNNRSVEGLFWEAHAQISTQSTATPGRAFVYLTTGHYAAERHIRVFEEWQEKKMFQALGVDAEALEAARRQQTD